MKTEHLKFMEGDKKYLQANALYLYNSFTNGTCEAGSSFFSNQW